MNAEPEIWKPVPGLTDVFASSLGYIKRRDFRHCWHHERPSSPDKWIINLGSIDGRGYRGITISLGHRRYVKQKAHRLVALAFIPNPLGLGDVNHKNGIKTDNRPENMEWCTRGHNNRHATATGLRIMPHGEGHSHSRLTEEKVREIFHDVTVNGMSQRAAGKKHGVNHSWAYAISKGKVWKHLNLCAPK